MNRNLVTFLIICLIAGFLAVTRPSPSPEPEQEPISPLFELGDCLKLKRAPKPDEWNLGTDKVYILRILGVGDYSYKYAFIDFVEMCLSRNEFCHVLDFEEQHLFIKTNCNP